MVARPQFMEPAKGLGAARRGTVMHFVMQHVDLQKLAATIRTVENKADAVAAADAIATADSTATADSAATADSTAATVDHALRAELEAQLVSMVAHEQLTAPEAEVVNIAAISAFFRTSFGKRMLSSSSVKRETAFNIEIKCTEIYKELSVEFYGNETMLLQGVIDCWFETEDGLVLLDYKTDYVPAGGSDLIRERYKIQLDYYTRALERITGEKVVEKYLYLFHNNELLSFENGD
jgi:ATP-dependent helicase/nuclease subunit A